MKNNWALFKYDIRNGAIIIVYLVKLDLFMKLRFLFDIAEDEQNNQQQQQQYNKNSQNSEDSEQKKLFFIAFVAHFFFFWFAQKNGFPFLSLCGDCGPSTQSPPLQLERYMKRFLNKHKTIEICMSTSIFTFIAIKEIEHKWRYK